MKNTLFYPTKVRLNVKKENELSRCHDHYCVMIIRISRGLVLIFIRNHRKNSFQIFFEITIFTWFVMAFGEIQKVDTKSSVYSIFYLKISSNNSNFSGRYNVVVWKYMLRDAYYHAVSTLLLAFGLSTYVHKCLCFLLSEVTLLIENNIVWEVVAKFKNVQRFKSHFTTI